LIAGLLPLDLLADKFVAIYHENRLLQDPNNPYDNIDTDAIRDKAKFLATQAWKNKLHKYRGSSGARVCQAIIPVLDSWLNRRFGNVNYHMTQIISGHGCFNAYIFKMKKVLSPACAHCCSLEDSAQHTLEICPAWEIEREELIQRIGVED
jgi:hypothetical protein